MAALVMMTMALGVSVTAPAEAEAERVRAQVGRVMSLRHQLARQQACGDGSYPLANASDRPPRLTAVLLVLELTRLWLLLSAERTPSSGLLQPCPSRAFECPPGSTRDLRGLLSAGLSVSAGTILEWPCQNQDQQEIRRSVPQARREEVTR